MVVPSARRGTHDDLHAAIRSVVDSLPLFAKVVTNIVSILLFKLRSKFKKVEQLAK